MYCEKCWILLGVILIEKISAGKELMQSSSPSSEKCPFFLDIGKLLDHIILFYCDCF